MIFRKLEEVQKHLQTIANQVGASRFESAKSAYLSGVVVVDEDGAPLEPGSYEFNVEIAAPAAGDEDMPADEAGKSDTDAIRKAIADEIRKAVPQIASKAAAVTRVEAGDSMPTFKALGRAQNLVKAFGGDVRKANEAAYGIGQFVRAACGSKSAANWLATKGTHIESDNTLGGFLVPEQFETSILDLREQYGVFRQYARRVAMSGDTATRPRRKSGLTTYFVDEGTEITESAKSWDQIRLVVKKLGILTYISNELNEDAVISIGDDFAQEVAWSFSLKEDQCGFLGDGSSTYGGIVGLQGAFAALGTASNSGGVVDATGSTWSAVTQADFSALVGKLPVYARRNAAWFCSATFYSEVMEQLILSAGGTTVADIQDGTVRQMFRGYPVVFSQVLPQATATGYPCFLGDLSLAASFGDRRGTTVAFSESAGDAFKKDLIAARGTTRFDIVVHDVGNNSATAADRVAGPVVALYIG